MLPLEYFLFLQIILFLFITPGTPRIVIISYSMNYGVKKCIWTALGDVTANIFQATLVIFVIGSFISDHPLFLSTFKWIGVVYISYLAYDIYKSKPKNINSNVRELEGAIISLIAQSSFNRAEITLDLAKDVINKFVKNNRREVSIDYIQKVVSDYFQMDIETLQSKTRKRHIVQARQIAMYFAKKFTKASLASIGTQIGRRDHATVLHACKTVDNLSFTDKQFRKYVEDLNQRLTV